jgi:DNA-binding CsgD family transcriptional regulator/PAS domain-containing protein
VDAAYATISLGSETGNQARFAAQSPWDPVQMQNLQDDYGFDDIPGLRPAISGDIDSPVTTFSVMSEADLHDTLFYRNWAAPQGLREACITKFAHTADRIGMLGCTTRVGRGVITKRERQFQALLSPHLRRAALIGDLLDHARIETDSYRAALDRLSISVVLTDADGTVLFANASAQSLFATQGPIVSSHGVLHAQNALIDGALLEAIEGAAHTDTLLGARGIGLPISAHGQPPAVAYILPLTKGTARAAFRPACAAVFISTTASVSPLTESVLATLFNLTPAEVRVFLLIGRGLTLPKCALLLSISENTLKTHLGRIFSKTDTSRQGDIVRLMLAIAAPI